MPVADPLLQSAHVEPRQYDAALRVIGLALEARGYEAPGHTDRMTEWAVGLGRKLRLGEEQLRELRWGALLHDCGKIMLPDEILLKPGKLTPHERHLMETHVEHGVRIVDKLGFVPKGSRQVILCHHERWDGKGYPQGLKGVKIPLLARIFAVAEVYDALLGERVYKPAMTEGEALKELWEAAKSGQLEPRLVETFVRMMDAPQIELEALETKPKNNYPYWEG